MPEERNEEMSLRDALASALSDEGVNETAEEQIEQSAAGAENGAVNAPEAMTNAESGGDIGENDVSGATAAGETVAAVEAPPASNGMPTHTEMWRAMQSLLAENQRMNAALQQREAQVNQQNEAMRQQSEAAESAIAGQFTPQAAVPAQATVSEAPPVLNMSEIGYLDPEKQHEVLSKWQQDSMNYAARMVAAQVKEEVMRELAPVREDYEAKRRIAENEAARTLLFSSPQFADMKGKEDEVEKIIAGTPLLNGAEPEQRYMLAALISRGIHSAKQPTTEELIEMATSNPDVMKAIEAKRVEEIRQNNASLPKVVPSSGMGNANAVPENKPKTMDDIRERLFRAIGGRR